MNALVGLPALVRAHLLETVRSRTALFWTFAFPLLFLFMLGGVMARGNSRVASYMMPGLFTNTLLAGSLFGVALRLVTDRETGVLRRYRVTPVTALVVVLAHGITALLTQVATFFLLWGIARAAFKVTSAGSPLALVGVFFAGAVALLPLGLVVGSGARDTKTAPSLTNILFFPMLFLSGAAFPFAMLPDWIKGFARLLPTAYMVEALSAVMVRGEGLRGALGPIVVLLLTGVVGIALTAVFFRWEGTDPVPVRRVATALGAIGLLYTGAALAAPEFKMARAPWSRSPEAGAARGQVRVLRGATVLDGLGARIERARIVIRDHRVAEVGPDGDAPLPAGAVVEDLSGRFVVPGLVDSHVHLGGSAGGFTTLAESLPERTVRDLSAYLGNGVTTVVSLTDDARDLVRLREEVALGRMRAPRVFLAGRSVTAPGGHPAAMFGPLADRLTEQVSTPAEARAAIERLGGEYVDLVKLVLEGGPPGRPMPRLEEAAFRAAVARARDLKLPTTVHVSRDADARLAVDAAAEGLEHIPFDLSDGTAALLALRRTTVTPTLVVLDLAWKSAAMNEPSVARWVDGPILESLRGRDSVFARLNHDRRVVEGLRARLDRCREAVRKAARAGVRILAGSDSGNPGTFHGPALLRELELLYEAGLTPEQLLAAVTSHAADRLGQKELGRIAPGAVADLVVLGSDPLAAVSAYRDVRAVYLGGRPLDRDRLFETSPGDWRPGL